MQRAPAHALYTLTRPPLCPPQEFFQNVLFFCGDLQELSLPGYHVRDGVSLVQMASSMPGIDRIVLPGEPLGPRPLSCLGTPRLTPPPASGMYPTFDSDEGMDFMSSLRRFGRVVLVPQHVGVEPGVLRHILAHPERGIGRMRWAPAPPCEAAARAALTQPRRAGASTSRSSSTPESSTGSTPSCPYQARSETCASSSAGHASPTSPPAWPWRRPPGTTTIR